MIRCFGNWTLILAVGALLGACGDAAQTGPTAQSGTSSRVDPSPVVRARWVAVVDAQSLAVVRFDDPLAPRTIPVVPMAAAGATDAASVTIVETLVAWSPDGERLAFVTQDGNELGIYGDEVVGRRSYRRLRAAGNPSAFRCPFYRALDRG